MDLELRAHELMIMALELLDRSGRGASISACHLQHAIVTGPRGIDDRDSNEIDV